MKVRHTNRQYYGSIDVFGFIYIFIDLSRFLGAVIYEPFIIVLELNDKLIFSWCGYYMNAGLFWQQASENEACIACAAGAISQY